jgi:hypothetical protein
MILQAAERLNGVDPSSFPSQLLDWGFEEDFEKKSSMVLSPSNISRSLMCMYLTKASPFPPYLYVYGRNGAW